MAMMPKERQPPEEDICTLDTSSKGRHQEQECCSAHEAVMTGLTSLESKWDSYFDRIFKWFGSNEQSQTTINCLIKQRDESRLEAQKLQDQLQIYSAKIKSQRLELQELKQKYNDSQDEVDKLKKEKSKLRSVILNQTGSEKVSDDEIKKLFTRIRQKIQAIAHSKAFHLDWDISVNSQCQPEVCQFWTNWNRLSLADRVFLMRGRMFDLVVDQILEQKLFGIIPSHSTCLEQIEHSLQELENHMVFSQVSTNAIVDWRHATMKAIDQTKTKHNYDGVVEPVITEHFGCLIPRQTDPLTLQKLHHDIQQMCKDAYQLRFLMRKSKDNYTCARFLAGANVHDNEEALEIHGVLHGGDEPSCVAFTICGALLKSLSNENMKPVVLEPAHVVVNSV